MIGAPTPRVRSENLAALGVFFEFFLFLGRFNPFTLFGESFGPLHYFFDTFVVHV